MAEDCVRLSGTLKKLKTQKKKFFVLHSGSSIGGPRLEYHDTEKKFKAASKAKRSILLQSCINISKRPDSKHKCSLIMFMKDDSFGIVFDTDKEQNVWFKTMLALQVEIGTKQRYEHVWEVQVKEKGLTDLKWLKAGAYRMYLTTKNIGFMRPNHDQEDIELSLATIRSCGHAEHFFNLEIGSAAVTGKASIWMQVDDSVIAQNMHEMVLTTMKSSSRDDMKPPPIFRHRSNTTDSNKHRSTLSLRRGSTSLGESSTLPRNIKSRPIKRRSTLNAGHNRDGTIHSLGDLGPRIRTDSVSSHGSHRTDHSAHSSDVEPDPFNGEHSAHGLGKSRGVRRDKSRKSVFDDEERSARQKDIMISPSTDTGSDVADGSSYMDMGAVGSGRKTRSHVSESESAYFPMGLGTSPANSTASSSVGLEESGYLEMNQRVVAQSPSQASRLPDAGYMEMKTPGGVARSHSATLRPDKVSSLLSDDSSYEGLDEFPPRANSVGSKPSALQFRERLSDAHAYMDMAPGARASQGSVKSQGKCCSSPHLGEQTSSNPLLRNSRANSPAVRSTDSSRSTTPRSGTPSHHLDSDLLMELDFRSGSHESLSDFRSRTSSAGSRDFHSSGFGSHDIRDRTGSTGSRDSMSRYHDGHRPRTATIGQETLRPRTSSFGPADMRPRALSHGTKYKDLSRRVKEKQLLLAEPKGKLRASSSRDSVGSGGSNKQTDLSIIRSRSQEYRTTLALPEEEYMTLSPGKPSTPPGGSFNTPPRSLPAHFHSTPTHDCHLKSKHVHMSPDIKMCFDQSNQSSKRHLYHKDRSRGSSSESLSSSSSDMGQGLKSKHSTRPKKISTNTSQSKVSPSGDKSDYIDASPQGVSNLGEDADDSYFLCDLGQDRSPKSSFSGLEKVISPIRDDITLSTFQIVSPIKEEDNDALFGPKPNPVDKETLERLRELKHEYVNVDFDEKKKRDAKNNSIRDSESEQNESTQIESKNISLDADSSIGYHSNSRAHDYMEIDISKNSTDASKTDTSGFDISNSSKSSDSNLKTNKNVSVDTDATKSTVLEAGRFHDYCEINVDDVKSSDSKPYVAIADPFGMLSSPSPMNEDKQRKKPNALDAKNSPTLSIPKTDVTSLLSIKSPKSPKSGAEGGHKNVERSKATCGFVQDPFAKLLPPAQVECTSQVSETKQLSPKSLGIDVFDIGAKPSGMSPQTEQSDKVRRVSYEEQRKLLTSTSSTTAFGEKGKTASQTSLRSTGNVLHISNSSTSLESMSRSRDDSGDTTGSRLSYHEHSSVGETTVARHLSRTSINSDTANAPQLNYARLDLNTSSDETAPPSIKEGQISPAINVHRSASFSNQADIIEPVSYAQIDFEKSELLKQSELLKREPEVAKQPQLEQVTKTEQPAPFDCL